MLRELACPSCGAPGLQAQQPSGVVVCSFCGGMFAGDERVGCPVCQTVHAASASFCAECGAKLKRTCPACAAENWAGADYCAACGRGLDAVAALADRHAHGFKGTLMRQRELANLIKAEEEQASQRRLGEMWQVEQRRQDLLARQQAEQRRQQGVLMALGLAGAGLFLLAIGVLVAFALIR